MGYYRLLLAVLVLVSHAYPPVFGWNIGVVAVMSFLVISGFTNALLIDRHYRDPRQVGWFYADKLARLFPLYWFYLAATVVLIAIFGLTIVDRQSPGLFILNAALLPVGYADFGFIDARLIPQAWTLGLELTFYLVLPLLLLFRRMTAVAIISSACVAAAAFAGVIPPYIYGYHLLPGLLFVFMAGAAFASPRVWNGASALAFFAGLAGVAVALAIPGSAHGFSKEIAAGISIGVVGVYLTKNIHPSRADQFTGNLTYGVYLNHYVLIALLDHLAIDRVWALPLSILLASATYLLIERPVIEWRRRLRANTGMASAVAPAIE